LAGRISGQVITNVLINGRSTAVVTDAQARHAAYVHVVVGGSGNILLFSSKRAC